MYSHSEFGLTPVVSEKYGHLDASYFAVAVVRADSGIQSLSQLRGKKSCHTAIDKTAGKTGDGGHILFQRGVVDFVCFI